MADRNHEHFREPVRRALCRACRECGREDLADVRPMKIETEQVLYRFQLSNFIRHGMSPLYEWIVETAHHQGLQGATVLKGFFGLRPEGSVLEERTWSLSQELPV